MLAAMTARKHSAAISERRPHESKWQAAVQTKSSEEGGAATSGAWRGQFWLLRCYALGCCSRTAPSVVACLLGVLTSAFRRMLYP